MKPNPLALKSGDEVSEKKIFAGAARSGKTTDQISEVIEKCRQGENPIYLGMDFVIMSRKKYDELVNKSQPTIEKAEL